MPRVEIPQSRRVISTSTGVSRTPDVSAPFREAQNLGATVGGIADDYIQKEKRRIDATYVANTSVQAEQEIEKLKTELRQQAEQPEGHADRFFQTSSEVYARYLEEAPSDAARLQLQSQFSGLQRGRYREESAYERGAIKSRDMQAYEDNSISLENQLFDNPENLEMIMFQQQQLDESLSTVLTPQEASQVADKRKEDLAYSYFKGLINRDAIQAKELLTSEGFEEFEDIIDVNKRQSLIKAADTKIARDEAEIRQQQQKEHRDFLTDTKTQIINGGLDQAGLDQLWEQGSFTPDEYLKMSRMHDQMLEKQGEQAFSNEYISNALQNNITLPITDKTTQQSIDRYYREVIQKDLEGKEPEEAMLAKISFFDDIGAIPSSELTRVKSDLASGTPEQKAQTAQFVTAIIDNTPRLATQFNIKDRAIADNISRNLQSLDVEDAVKAAEVAVLDRKTPQYKAKLAEYEFSKPVFDDDDFTSSSFNFFSNKPSTVPEGMISQFDQMVKTLVVDLEVPVNRAEEIAYQTIQKEWTITDINGDDEYMRFAPESVYGVAGADNNWIREELVSDVRTFTGQEDIDAVVQPIPTTFNNPRGVRYNIFTINEDTGYLEVLKDSEGIPVEWSPNVPARVMEMTREAEIERQKIVSKKITDVRRQIENNQRGGRLLPENTIGGVR